MKDILIMNSNQFLHQILFTFPNFTKDGEDRSGNCSFPCCVDFIREVDTEDYRDHQGTGNYTGPTRIRFFNEW